MVEKREGTRIATIAVQFRRKIALPQIQSSDEAWKIFSPATTYLMIKKVSRTNQIN